MLSIENIYRAMASADTLRRVCRPRDGDSCRKSTLG